VLNKLLQYADINVYALIVLCKISYHILNCFSFVNNHCSYYPDSSFLKYRYSSVHISVSVINGQLETNDTPEVIVGHDRQQVDKWP